MRDVASHGRTVLFVSHNLGAIRRLCDRAVLLHDGHVTADGDPVGVLSGYVGDALAHELGMGADVPDAIARIGSGAAKLRRISIGASDRPTATLHLDEPFSVTAEFDVAEHIHDAVVEVGVSTVEGERVATLNSTDRERPPLAFPAGRQRITVEPELSLLPGEFALDVGIHHRDGTTLDYVQGVHRFSVLNAAQGGDDHYPWAAVRGQVRPRAAWGGVERVDAPARVSQRDGHPAS